MEMGYMWMRRVRFGGNPLSLAMAYSSSATTLPCIRPHPLFSFNCFKPPHLISLPSSYGPRSISISTPSCCSSASSLLSLPENHDFPDSERGQTYTHLPKGSKVLLKGLNYAEFQVGLYFIWTIYGLKFVFWIRVSNLIGGFLCQEWVQSHGFRPGQALMLWKRLYGDNIWAHDIDELEGFFFLSIKLTSSTREPCFSFVFCFCNLANERTDLVPMLFL